MRSLLPLSLTVICFTGIYQLLRCMVEVGARDVQGLPLLAKPAPRQNYVPMASKPASSSHEAPTSMEPGTCHTDLSVEE